MKYITPVGIVADISAKAQIETDGDEPSNNITEESPFIVIPRMTCFMIPEPSRSLHVNITSKVSARSVDIWVAMKTVDLT